MWPGSSVLIVINALIFLVHSLPPNTDWNTLRNDSVVRNERILKLFLQLAMHAANRLTHLKKETDKGYDCNRHNDNSLISTADDLITQSPSQANLEQPDNSQEVVNHSSSSDFEINADQNQTTSPPQLQELLNPDNFSNIDDQNVNNLNSKMSNLILKSVQDVRNASSDITGHDHEAPFDILKPILDSNTTTDSLNVNEFRAVSPKSVSNGVNEKLLDQIDLVNNITNASAMNDLTKTINKFLPKSQNLQESILENSEENQKSFDISQRLFGADLAQSVSKVSVHENANEHIPPQNTQPTQEPSDKINDISQRFFDPIKNSGNILNSPITDHLPVVNQILSSTKNVVESMISKVLPEATKGESNLLNQIVPQDAVNRLLKIPEEGQKYLAHSDYVQQEQSKNVKQAENQFDDLLHNQQNLTSNVESTNEAADASRMNNQQTITTDLPINNDNSIRENNNKQFMPTLLKDPSIPLFRSLPDFNEHENNGSNTEIDLSSIQMNDNISFIDEKQSIEHREKLEQDQINEEIKPEDFKKMNETKTNYNDEQLNPISEDLPQKSEENGLTNVAVVSSVSPNQLDSDVFTFTEQAESLSAQDTENVNNVTKSDLNRSIENQIIYIDNLLESNSSLIGDLEKENLDEQLSEAKLQEISDRLINALWPIIEKKMDNNRSYVTDHYNNKQWNKNLPSNRT